MTTWQINTREDGLELIDALALRVPAAPRGLLRQLCKKQRVAIDGCTASAGRTVVAGETISVRSSIRWQACLDQSRLQPGEVLYEDFQCLVIEKPAGLAVHRAPGHEDNLLQRISDFLRLRGETFRTAPIQRLDKGTSGAVLVGKGRSAISQLGQMMMAGLAVKRYLAMVEGEFNTTRVLSSPVPSKGRQKTALTRCRPACTTGIYTLLDLELGTGRYHQIRRQLAEAGWPLLGDTRYGGRPVPGLDRFFLHCYQLTFQQPMTGVTVAVTTCLPAELQRVMQRLGLPALRGGLADRQKSAAAWQIKV